MPKRVTTTLILFMIPSLLWSVNPPAARNPTNSAHFNSARSPEPWYWCVLLLLYCKSPLFRVCVTLVLQQIVRDIKLVSFCLSEGFFEVCDLVSEIFCVLLSWSSFGLFCKNDKNDKMSKSGFRPCAARVSEKIRKILSFVFDVIFSLATDC